MEIKPVFLIILDISGYTRFIVKHRIALIHAEKIIGELMESILDEVEPPVMKYELLGDAVSLYAEDSGEPGLANNILDQTKRYFKAFRNKEASLISNCSVCNCPACDEIGKLKLKAILHRGETVFSKVKDDLKISGEDMILVHRLLKNSVASNEYILLTDSVAKMLATPFLTKNAFGKQTENCEGFGEVEVWVKNFEPLDEPLPLPGSTRRVKLMGKFMIYTFPRLIMRQLGQKPAYDYKNLPVG